MIAAQQRRLGARRGNRGRFVLDLQRVQFGLHVAPKIVDVAVECSETARGRRDGPAPYLLPAKCVFARRTHER